MEKKVSLKKAFELACLDITCERFVQPSLGGTGMFLCVRINVNDYLALTYYGKDYDSIIYFNGITQRIDNITGEYLMQLHQKERIAKGEMSISEKAEKLLIDRFGNQIFA